MFHHYFLVQHTVNLTKHNFLLLNERERFISKYLETQRTKNFYKVYIDTETKTISLSLFSISALVDNLFAGFICFA